MTYLLPIIADRFHPIANLFPLIEGEEFDAFVADVGAKMLAERIITLQGMILDGRNRYRALLALGTITVETPLTDPRWFVEFNEANFGADAIAAGPLEHVISLNLRRRHLTTEQRSFLGVEMATMRQGERVDLEPSAKLPKVDQETAARLVGVSARSVRSAKTIQERGTPALVEAVKSGRIALALGEQAAKLSPETQAAAVALADSGKANAVRTAIKQGNRNERERVLGAKQSQLPNKVYGVILADPEWRFLVYSRETGLDRSADQHYPTSDEADIMARQVDKIAARDCMCARWTTDLARGIRVLESWGFTYKSYFAWVKDIVPAGKDELGRNLFVQIGPSGNGFWNRDRDEVLLIGTRGDFVAPAMGTQPESVIFAARPRLDDADRGKHSAKPLFAHEWIDANWPNLSKIELNARAARDGWDVWGNEAPDEIPAGSPVGQPGQPESMSDAAASVSAQDDAGAGPEGITAEMSAAPNPGAVASVPGPVSKVRALADAVGSEPRWKTQLVAPSQETTEMPRFLRRDIPKSEGGAG